MMRKNKLDAQKKEKIGTIVNYGTHTLACFDENAGAGDSLFFRARYLHRDMRPHHTLHMTVPVVISLT